MGFLPFKKVDVFPFASLIIDTNIWKYLQTWLRLFLASEKKRTIYIGAIQALLNKTTGQKRNSICGLSVRTLFDLYLSSQQFPEQSEIIMSAINIPDMAKIIEKHRLVAIAWDIELDTLAPNPELLEKLINEKTVAILIAHIYGKRCDLTKYNAIAERYKLQVIEDYAECFFDSSDLSQFESDLKLYSLGIIKYHTAFAGAFAFVREQSIYKKMIYQQQGYTLQSNREFARKLLNAGFMMFLLNNPLVTGCILFLSKILSNDSIPNKIQSSLRAFPQNLFEKIRKKPSPALLLSILSSIKTASLSDGNIIKEKGDRLARQLPQTMRAPGQKAKHSNYWLYPILVRKREVAFKKLKAAGLYVFTQSSLRIVGHDHPLHPPKQARTFLDNVIYLPFSKKLSNKNIDNLAKIITKKS